MEQVGGSTRPLRQGHNYPLTVNLSRPDDFTPACQQYAENYGMDYNSLQFVVGHPVDSNTHASNAIITKGEVCPIRLI